MHHMFTLGSASIFWSYNSQISYECAYMWNINMVSKRTSKSAAKAIITCLIEENDSENANEYFESSDENSNEYSDVQLKFVDENTINLEVNDACNRENWLDHA